MTGRRLQYLSYWVLTCLIVVSVSACSPKIDLPTGFPTPPPRPAAGPLAAIDLKIDQQLSTALAEIAADSRGKVGVAAVNMESGAAALLNASDRFPMQSVYKLPISMAILDQVRLEKLDLDERIGVAKDDMVRSGMRSPLRDANPNGGEFTIRELIRLSMVESDGTASDVLMRVAGGAPEIQAFLGQIGVFEMAVANPEKEIGRDWQTQYANYSTPLAAIDLLRWLDASASSYGQEAEQNESQLLLEFMANSVPGARRLKGQLPAGTYIAHKTGTSGTQNGVTAATNDIGILRLPNGTRVAVAVFVSDSTADEKTREAVIARIAKAVYDHWSK